MAFSVNCSVRVVPRPPDSKSSATSRATQLPTKENNGSWRRRCAFGLASLMLTLEFGNFFAANETRALESPSQLVDSRRTNISRWSDKRKCPPWRANSLEIIVPENLPRPSRRRNWEIVTGIQNAPAIQATTVKSSSRYCFSL